MILCLDIDNNSSCSCCLRKLGTKANVVENLALVGNIIFGIVCSERWQRCRCTWHNANGTDFRLFRKTMLYNVLNRKIVEFLGCVFENPGADFLMSQNSFANIVVLDLLRGNAFYGVFDN